MSSKAGSFYQGKCPHPQAAQELCLHCDTSFCHCCQKSHVEQLRLELNIMTSGFFDRLATTKNRSVARDLSAEIEQLKPEVEKCLNQSCLLLPLNSTSKLFNRVFDLDRKIAKIETLDCQHIGSLFEKTQNEIKIPRDMIALFPVCTYEDGGLSVLKKIIARPGLLPACRGFIGNYRNPTNQMMPVLNFCIRSGNAELVRFFVEELGTDVFLRDSSDEGKMAIHEAIAVARPFRNQKSMAHVVEYLLNRFPDLASVRTNPPGNKTLLHLAAKVGCYEICEFLVKKFNVPVEDSLCKCESILANAVSSGNVKIVKLFIEHGGRIEHRPSIPPNSTPFLNLAVKAEKVDLVKYLLDLKPGFINERDSMGRNALNQVATSCYMHIEAKYSYEESLNSGKLDAKLAAIQSDDREEAIFRVWGYYCDDVMDTHMVGKYLAGLEMARLLIERGIDMLNRDSDGNTALHEAAKRGSSELVRLFLEKCPALFGLKNKDGRTALELAMSPRGKMGDDAFDQYGEDEDDFYDSDLDSKTISYLMEFGAKGPA